jgi:AraC family transcriptional regulator
MVSTIQASAEIFREVIPGEVIREQLGESGDDVCVQILTRHRHQENIVIPAVPEPLIVWIVSGEAMVEERALGGEWKGNRVLEGDFFLTTATAPTEMRWKVSGTLPFEVMHVYIGLTLLQHAIRDVCGKPIRAFTLREVSGEKDGILSSLLEQIKRELSERDPPSRLYIQGLARSLTVHVVRSYATASVQGAGPRGGLQAYKLRKIVDAMTQSLAETFILSRYAAIAELSDFHFSRVFKQTTTLSPSSFFNRLRMEHAKVLLLESELSILDVCAAVGYASPSHLSTRFRGATGMTPSEYRRMHKTSKVH